MTIDTLSGSEPACVFFERSKKLVRQEISVAAKRPIFVISDLHIGDNGRRDNLAVKNREKLLRYFLDHVEAEGGELVILGDLFEFCRCNLGKVLVSRKSLLDRLTKMHARYVIGNHDIELAPMIGAEILRHPFFDNMTHPFMRKIGGKKFMFMHGHEMDPLNRSDNPGWGRLLGIFRGIIEEKNGEPLAFGGRITSAYSGMKDKALRHFDKLKERMLKNRISKKPKLARTMVRRYHRDMLEHGYDVAIVGHTHKAGRCSDWYYNSGSWTGRTNDFLKIMPDGTVEIYKWCEEGAVPNHKVIRY
jgi:UDP-2,3-diacylglucosamine pyrophosphatase LpxH